MTDKEQALVAAAYWFAASVCEKHQSAARDIAYKIRELTPADAEDHLRALMMKVAWAVLGSCILEGTENFQGAEKIVDEVLYRK